MEAFSSVKLYFIRGLAANVYVNLGPVVQYAFLKNFSTIRGAKTESFFTEDQSGKIDDYINSFNWGLKGGVGARVFKDFLEIRLSVRRWFRENANSKSSISKSSGLSRFHFGESEWDIEASVGINFI